MRTLSRLSAVALTAALAFGVSSCSEDAAPPKADPVPTETPTNDATDSPTMKPVKNPNKPGGESLICREPDKMTPFTGAAAAKFGADEVMDAYCEMADFFYLNSVTGVTAPRDAYKPIELSFVKDWLAPAAKRDWDKKVADDLADLTDGDNAINSLIYFNLRSIEDLGYTFPTDPKAPMMVSGGVGLAQTDVATLPDGRDALDLDFTVANNLVIEKGGKLWVISIDRTVSLRLSQADDSVADPHSWLIEGWKTDWQSTVPEPLKGFTSTKEG